MSVCLANAPPQRQQARFYQPRRPRASPLFRIVEEHFDEFQRVYPDRYQETYGFWRPATAKAVSRYLKCGDLHEGFARVKCRDCHHEFFVAFSCKQRCVCPSCHQKRALLISMRLAEVMSPLAPHCQFVFTVPKRLRIYFRFDRSLLGDMALCAWETLLQVYRTVLGRDDLVPGMIAGIQTFGELAHWHPHIHAIATDGVFTPEGRFLPLPSVANEPFVKL